MAAIIAVLIEVAGMAIVSLALHVWVRKLRRDREAQKAAEADTVSITIQVPRVTVADGCSVQPCDLAAVALVVSWRCKRAALALQQQAMESIIAQIAEDEAERDVDRTLLAIFDGAS
jgi:hypothetical protein